MAGLPQNQRDQLLLLIAIVGFAGAGLYWYFAFDPKQAELAKVATHVDSLDAGNQRAKSQLAKGSVASIRAESQRLRANLDLMRTLVPAGNEVPALLDQVTTATRRAGLDLSLIEPEAVIPGEQFDTYRYKLRTIGSFHEIGEMLTNIASMTRIVAPINLQLTISNAPAAVKAGTPDKVPLQASFEIQTYAVKTTPGGDAPPSTPAKPGKKG
jgi:type IV pilus assembly protein PilO